MDIKHLKENNFKDSTGKYRTQSLFIEYRDRNGNYAPIYNLKNYDQTDHDGNLIRSLKNLYLDLGDITEYEFANLYFDGWDHWQRVCNNAYLKKEIDNWRFELELKMKAEAIRAIRAIAKDEGDKGQLSAAKYIAEKGWETKRGRPSKEEIAKERKINANLHSIVDDEYERLIGEKKSIN